MDDLLQPAPHEVLKVTDLTRRIKQVLEGPFNQVWVQGEISNLRRQSSGHVYFSVKDSGSQLPCAMFARDAARQSFELEDGMEVLLLGDVSVYEPQGRYQLIAKIAIRSGEGSLQLEYERLKKKLAAEGLFDPERKQALPTLPRRIALITSPSGAALRDFLRILKRRQYRGQVVIFPARVQGRQAAGEVARMLAHANASSGFDLIVITRGGGSIEDLWAFNEESLSRAIAASRLPVISAIGHEIDHVLADFAADRRAETPSGAAELISSLYLDAIRRFDHAEEALIEQLESALRERQHTLESLHSRLQLIAPSRRLELFSMRLDELEHHLKHHAQRSINREHIRLHQLAQRIQQHHPSGHIQLARQKVDSHAARIKRAAHETLKTQHQNLENFSKRLKNNSLNATLQRGYAIIQSEDGRIISDAAGFAGEKNVLARMKDGEVKLRTQV